MKTSVPPDFAHRIKTIRQQFNLTQVRLAELMGVSFASVNRWENSKAKPSVLAWQQIARAELLGVKALYKDFQFPLESNRQVNKDQAGFNSTRDQAILDFSTPADRHDLLALRGGKSAEEESESNTDDGESNESEGTGSLFRLKAWNLRKRPNRGYKHGEEQTLTCLPLFPDLPTEHESNGGFVIPLIDQVHHLLHLWRAGDVTRVDDYLERRALKRNQLFQQLLQALIELSPRASEERALLESISNQLGAGGKQPQTRL